LEKDSAVGHKGLSCRRIPLVPDKGPYYGFAFKKRKPKCFTCRCNHDPREFRNKLIVFVVEVAAVEGKQVLISGELNHTLKGSLSRD
jgi:hypothetical protein